MPDDTSGSAPAVELDKKMPRRGPTGDVIPRADDVDPRTRGGNPQEDVEDRPNVSSVTPEDYPAKDRADSLPVNI